MVRISVANRNAAGVYLPVPKPTANGTLNSIAEIGAAPVTPTKMTPHRPIAFGLSRSTPDSSTEKDSMVPGWVTPIGCVFAMRSLVSPTPDEVVRQAACIEPVPRPWWQGSHDVDRSADQRWRGGRRAGADHDPRAVTPEQVVRTL